MPSHLPSAVQAEPKHLIPAHSSPTDRLTLPSPPSPVSLAPIIEPAVLPCTSPSLCSLSAHFPVDPPTSSPAARYCLPSNPYTPACPSGLDESCSLNHLPPPLAACKALAACGGWLEGGWWQAAGSVWQAALPIDSKHQLQAKKPALCTQLAATSATCRRGAPPSLCCCRCAMPRHLVRPRRHRSAVPPCFLQLAGLAAAERARLA